MVLKTISLNKVPEIFRKDANPNIPKEIIIKDGYLTSRFEYLALATLCSLKDPKNIFEIGTFEGYSTSILAMNAPKSRIYTLDLSPDIKKTKFDIGKLNRKYTPIKRKISFLSTKYSHRIKRLFGDSATFDFSKFKDKMDFVFIDGAHTYEYTKNDTEKALEITKNKGVLVWHDFNHLYWPETVKFLKEFSKIYNLYHIKNTYLVFLIK